MIIDKKLLFPRSEFKTKQDLFKWAGSQLLAGDYVLETWPEALALREQDYPTGVQVSGGGVALPHTDAKHATQNTLAVVTLNNPITFQSMGGDGDAVEATTIVFLVFSDPKQHLKSLSKMVKAIQSEEFLTALQDAETVEDMQVVLEERLEQQSPTH